MELYDLRKSLGNFKFAAKERSYINGLRKDQWKRRGDLERIQLQKLKAIIRQAYDHTRYYHELFTHAKIKPDDIKSLQDLRKIPLTSKTDVQNRHSDLTSDNVNPNRCTVARTTGSTGTPLKILKDREAVYYSAALRLYPFFECGLMSHDKFVEIADPIQPDARKARYKYGLLEVEQISVFNSPKDTLVMLDEIKPDAIYTFPSVLTCLFNELKGSDFRISPKLVFSQGETLGQKCRQLTRSVLGIEINDTYGSAEFSRLAFECNEHSGLHMITDCAALEFLRDGENVSFGEEGEIVVTDLYNYAMPLIRYRLGDVGIPVGDECACGRGWPLIKSIVGRTDDFLVLPSGTIISPRAISVIEYVDGMRQYQVVQESRDKFIVKLVKGEDFSENTVKEVETQIRLGCSGEKVEIEVQIVDEIPKERTGKIRKVISKVRR